MKTKTYQGWLATCEYGFLSLSETKDESYGPSIANKIDEDWKTGERVSLRYYIADDKVTPEEAVRALVAKLYGGEMDVKYVLEAYSEYTIEEWEENLRIGGHDLVEELKSHAGKFAVIVVEEASSPNMKVTNTGA